MFPYASKVQRGAYFYSPPLFYKKIFVVIKCNIIYLQKIYNMSIELTLLLIYFFTFFVAIISILIMVLGTWIVINYFIWEILIRKSFSWTIYYKRLFYFLWYYKDIKNIIGNKADNLFEEEKPPNK